MATMAYFKDTSKMARRRERVRSTARHDSRPQATPQALVRFSPGVRGCGLGDGLSDRERVTKVWASAVLTAASKGTSGRFYRLTSRAILPLVAYIGFMSHEVAHVRARPARSLSSPTLSRSLRRVRAPWNTVLRRVSFGIVAIPRHAAPHATRLIGRAHRVCLPEPAARGGSPAQVSAGAARRQAAGPA